MKLAERLIETLLPRFKTSRSLIAPAHIVVKVSGARNVAVFG